MLCCQQTSDDDEQRGARSEWESNAAAAARSTTWLPSRKAVAHQPALEPPPLQPHQLHRPLLPHSALPPFWLLLLLCSLTPNDARGLIWLQCSAC